MFRYLTRVLVREQMIPNSEFSKERTSSLPITQSLSIAPTPVNCLLAVTIRQDEGLYIPCDFSQVTVYLVLEVKCAIAAPRLNRERLHVRGGRLDSEKEIDSRDLVPIARHGEEPIFLVIA
jgi:hypothetical protein